MKKFIDPVEWKLFHPLYLALFIGIAIPDIDMVVVAFFLTKGFTATDIGIGLALQSLFILLSEIPTGVYADIFGKRKSIQISWMLQSIIFASFFSIRQPWMMWLLYAIKGTALTFSSGAFEALPYEIADRAKRTDLIKNYFRTEELLYQVATALSNINVVLFLYLIGSDRKYNIFGQSHLGIDFLWLTGAVGYFVGALILFKLHEKSTHLKNNLNNTFKESIQIAKKAITYSSTHSVVSRLLVVGVFTQVVFILFSDIVYQPFLLNIGMKVEHIAVLVGFGSIVAAIFSQLSHNLSRKIGSDKKYIEYAYIVKSIVLTCLIFFSGPIFGIIFFLIYFAFDSLISPLLTPFKQRFYKNEMRATLGSVESVIKNITSIICFPLIGIMLDNIGPRYTVIIAIIPLLIMYIVFRNIKYSHVPEQI